MSIAASSPKKHTNHIRITRSDRLAKIVACVIVGGFSIICLYPLLLTLTGLAQSRDTATELLTLFGDALRDLILLGRSETATPVYFTDREAAEDLSARFTASRLLRFAAAVDAAKDALAANANVKLTLARLADRLAGA